jgi:hypothetical protein
MIESTLAGRGAMPSTGPHANEIQSFGTVVPVPIALAGLRVTEVADHYVDLVRALDEPDH